MKIAAGYYSGGTISTENAYNKGYSDGYAANNRAITTVNSYHHHSLTTTSYTTNSASGGSYNDNFVSDSSRGCFTKPYYHIAYSYTTRGRCNGNVTTGTNDPVNDPAGVYDYCESCGKRWTAWEGPNTCDNDVDKQESANYWTENSADPHIGYCIETKYTRSCGLLEGQLISSTFNYVKY